MTKPDWPWLENCCYEPAPIQYTSPRAPLTAKVFALLCVLAALGGILWAVNS